MERREWSKFLWIIIIGMMIYIALLALVSTGVVRLPPMPTPVGTPQPPIWWESPW